MCLALNLEKRFEDKPVLQKMLVNGEASINKLARVVSIATVENEEELAEKIKVLPKSALDTLVRDEKFANSQEGAEPVSEKQNGLQITLFKTKSLPGQALDFEFSDDVIKELNELHTKGFDVNELLRRMLEQRQKEIIQKKEEIAEIEAERNSSPHAREVRRRRHILAHSVDIKFHRARESALVGV